MKPIVLFILKINTYNFNIIDKPLAKLKKKVNAKVTEQISCNGMHHPNEDGEHLDVKRENNGKGLIQ